jgi:NADH:ubiquinone oxidoreductase subunit C
MTFFASSIESFVPHFICGARPTKTGVILDVPVFFLPLLARAISGLSLLRLCTLLDIVAVDTPSKSARFAINYIFFSTRHGFRLTVRTVVHALRPVPALGLIGGFSCAG